MSITAAAVLYVVIWFVTMFVVLPIRLRTQGDEGEIVPGTHAGAPANFKLGRTLLIVTLVGTVVWAIISGIIISGLIGIEDIDWFDRYDDVSG
jgi:predicted secreted protein